MEKYLTNRFTNLKGVVLSVLFSFIVPLTLWSQVDFPGTVISSSSNNELYMASPSIAIMSDGTYVVSHDWPQAITSIYVSTNRGDTWEAVSQVPDMRWATLFVNRDTLYLMGVKNAFQEIRIVRSTDKGKNWTVPIDSNTGILLSGRYHTAPVPVVIYNNRIWRSFEDSPSPTDERDFHSFVISAPIDSDLLKASSWTKSDSLRLDESWINATDPHWLEGNVVVKPGGGLINFMRIEAYNNASIPFALTGSAAGKKRFQTAMKINISTDGKYMSFDNNSSDFVDFPGAESKFTIRYDSISNKYWTIVNKISNTSDSTYNTYLWQPNQRNVLMLMSSSDLVTWDSCYKVIRWNEGRKMTNRDVFGFQYADWQFEGDDIVAVSRTAWYGKWYHDANMVTFHRIENFRTKVLADSPDDLFPYTQKPTILSWQLGSPLSTGIETSVNSTTTNSNLEISVLERGTGIEPNSSGLSGSFFSRTASGWPSTENDALTDNTYYQFKVKAKNAYSFSLATLDVKLRRSGDGPTQYRWYYSLDSINFRPIGRMFLPFTSGLTFGEQQSTVYLSGIEDLQHVPSNNNVYIRLYAWAASGVSGSFSIGRNTTTDLSDVLAIGGEVFSTPQKDSSILGWSFTGPVPTGINDTLNSTLAVTHANVKTSTLKRGSGFKIPETTLFGTFNSNSESFFPDDNTQSNAIANDEYYEFTVRADNGYNVSLKELNVKLRRNASGPTMYSWMYSLNDVDFQQIGGAVNFLDSETNGVRQSVIRLDTIPALQNVSSDTSIVFRLYAWGATSSVGGFAIGRYVSTETDPLLWLTGEVSESETALRDNNTLLLNGTRQYNSVKLNWEIAPSRQPFQFKILRSTDNNFFSPIATIEGNGEESIYHYFDNNPAYGANYYQLQKIDNYQDIKKSEIIVVNTLDKAAPYINVFYADNILTALLFHPEGGKGELNILDISGRRLINHKAHFEKGYSRLHFTTNLKPGVYIVDVNFETGTSLQTKFIR